MSVQPPAPERASAAEVPTQSGPVEDAAPPAPPASPIEAEVPVTEQSEQSEQSEPSPFRPARPNTQRPVASKPKTGRKGLVGRLAALPKAALLGGAGVMAALLVALTAFVIVPAFGSHQAKSEWTDTTVSLPAKVGNLKRLKSKQITALVKVMAANGIPRNGIGVYGTLGKNAVILVATKPAQPLTDADQELQRKAMEKGFVSASKISGFQLVEQSDAGPLGGYLGCGKATNSTVTVCLTTDAGSVVGTITGPTVKDAAALTRTARAAAVRRS